MTQDDNSTRRLRVAQDDQDGDSVVVTTVTSPRRRVDSAASWLEAWTTYVAARVNTSPSMAPQLMAYQGLIATAMQRYPLAQVLQYDRSFRLMIAQDPTMRWDRRDVDLYVQAFTSPVAHHATEPGHRQPFRRGGPRKCRPRKRGKLLTQAANLKQGTLLQLQSRK